MLEFPFTRAVEEGRRRVTRSGRVLAATGLVGGVDIGLGVIALLVTLEATGSELLGGLAFSIGFIALTLGRSELFTENFLVPVAALVAGKATARQVVRLWVGTLVANLAGGWLVMALVTSTVPRLEGAAQKLGGHFHELGLGWSSFGLALLGGAAITVMTWMERGTTSSGSKLVAAISTAFLLIAVPLNHSVVISLEMFAALQYGAPFGYADWAGVLGVAVAGNVLGGVGLVTILRLAQVAPETIQDQRNRTVEDVDSSHEPPDEQA